VTGAAPRGGAKVVEYGLIAAIFVGSLALWIAVPYASLWIASHLSDDATTVVLAVLIICPVAMVAFGLVLARLYRVYLRVSGADVIRRGRSAWLGSLSGDRVRRGPRPVLEVSLTVSAVVAVVLMLVWFFVFAENPMPGSPVP
jgi:hypothetical protein